MKINDNFSITRLFITKKVTIFLEDKNSFDIQLYSIKDYYENDDLNAIYHLANSDGIFRKNGFDSILTKFCAVI